MKSARDFESLALKKHLDSLKKAERSTACSARSVAETLDQKLCRIFQKLFEGSVHYALLKKGKWQQ